MKYKITPAGDKIMIRIMGPKNKELDKWEISPCNAQFIIPYLRDLPQPPTAKSAEMVMCCLYNCAYRKCKD